MSVNFWTRWWKFHRELLQGYLRTLQLLRWNGLCWKVSSPKRVTYVTSSASSLDLPQRTVPCLWWHFSKQDRDQGLWQQTISKEAPGAPWCAQQVPAGEGSPRSPALSHYLAVQNLVTGFSSSWHSGASHASHKLWLDSSQLLSPTNSSHEISLLMCPTGP